MTAGSMPDETCRACELIWSCAALPAEAMHDRIEAAVTSDADGTRVQNALSVVRNRLWREHGIDPSDIAERMKVIAAIAQGRGSPAEVALIARIDAATAVGQYALDLFPAGVASSADADLQTLVASTPPLQAAIQATGIGVATPASLDALKAAIDTFAALGERWGEPAATTRAWWLGLGWWAQSRGLLRFGRAREARDAMALAADFYARAGEAADAAKCHDEVSQIETRFAADFDTEADREARKLLEPQAPLDRVKALVKMIGTVGGTGDAFEANRLADETAILLAHNGYPDPEHAFDAAVEAWIGNATKDCRGNVLLQRLADVTVTWAQILGARTSARITSDPAGSARAERALRGLQTLVGEFGQQAARANAELAQRFEVWMPNTAGTLAPAAPPDAGAASVEALTQLDDELLRVRIACNEGASERQLETAQALQARAEGLGSRVHVARAMVEQAYVLLALDRNGEVPPLADRAVRTLLGDRAPSLSAFGTGYERELYLTAIDYKARALAGLAQHEALFALLEPVILDIEAERARVSSPYQQSAFLATRAELYEMAAAAAYRLGRIDGLLAIGELLKARAALRSRLSPPVEARADDLEARYRATNDALMRCVPGSPEEATLRDARRWLQTAREIARARQAGAVVPEVSIAAIQAVLAPDECAVWWLWIGSDIALVVAVGRDAMRHAVVRLDPAQKASLDRYLATLKTLSGTDPADETPSRLSALVTELGTIFLPAPVRAFVAGKARLVLSPHRSLHLVPFHAAPWPGGYVVEHFAVRYVPNLASLLVPWDGNVDGRVLAVGVGTFDSPGIEALPNADAEAALVAAVHGDNGVSMLDATRAQFTGARLQDYKCVHLATHGSSVLADVAMNDPMQSCLFLRDGPLNGFELAALPLRAELVVLAACYSGQRAIAGRGLTRLPGDDLFGLQGVLFEAGAGALLGALWQVADDVARPILADFHRAYAGGAAPDAALQRALVAHLRDPRRPKGLFFWAPFFLSALGRRPAAA